MAAGTIILLLTLSAIAFAAGYVVKAVMTKLRGMGRVEANIINPRNNRCHRVYVLPGAKSLKMKIHGKPVDIPLKPRDRHALTGEAAFQTSAFFINQGNGLPLHINDQEEWDWPTAYDMVVPYMDGRAKAIMDSTKEAGVEWAKWGAIAGGGAVVLLLLLLGLMWQLLERARDAGVGT